MSTSATYAVNLPLTNYIIGWYGTQTHDPARFLAPGVKAPGLLTTYKRYLRQDAFAAIFSFACARTLLRQISLLPVAFPAEHYSFIRRTFL